MKKWLRLSEVAEAIGMPVATQAQRRESRRSVRRMLRKMEARDGVKYLHRDVKGGWLRVSVGKLEELLPWEPGTLTGIRRDIGAINGQMRDMRRGQNGHGSKLRQHAARLSDLERFRRGVDAFFAITRGERLEELEHK